MAVDAFIWFEGANVGSTPEGETTDELFSKERHSRSRIFRSASKPDDDRLDDRRCWCRQGQVQRVHHQEDDRQILTPAVQELLRRRTLRVGDHRHTQGRRRPGNCRQDACVQV